MTDFQLEYQNDREINRVINSQDKNKLKVKFNLPEIDVELEPDRCFYDEGYEAFIQGIVRGT